MISKYTQKNKYGGYTYHIKLDSLFHVFIHGADNGSYIVEFKEWRFVSYKTRFSFVSNEELESAVTEAFDRMYQYFQNHKDYKWSIQQRDNVLNRVLGEFESMKY